MAGIPEPQDIYGPGFIVHGIKAPKAGAPRDLEQITVKGCASDVEKRPGTWPFQNIVTNGFLKQGPVGLRRVRVKLPEPFSKIIDLMNSASSNL